MDNKIVKNYRSGLCSKKDIILSRSLGAENYREKPTEVENIPIHVISDDDSDHNIPSRTSQKNASPIDVLLESLHKAIDDEKSSENTEVDSAHKKRRTEDSVSNPDHNLGEDTNFVTPPASEEHPEVIELESLSSHNHNTRLNSQASESEFIVSSSEGRSTPQRPHKLKNTIPADSFERFLTNISKIYPEMTDLDRVLRWNVSSEFSDFEDDGIREDISNMNSLVLTGKHTSMHLSSSANDNEEACSSRDYSPNLRTSRHCYRNRKLMPKPDAEKSPTKKSEIFNKTELDNSENTGKVLMSINTLTQTIYTHRKSLSDEERSLSPVQLVVVSSEDDSFFRNNSLNPEIDKKAKIIAKKTYSKGHTITENNELGAFKVPNAPISNVKYMTNNKIDASCKEEFYKYLGLGTRSPTEKLEDEHIEVKRRSLRVKLQQGQTSPYNRSPENKSVSLIKKLENIKTKPHSVLINGLPPIPSTETVIKEELQPEKLEALIVDQIEIESKLDNVQNKLRKDSPNLKTTVLTPPDTKSVTSPVSKIMPPLVKPAVLTPVSKIMPPLVKPAVLTPVTITVSAPVTTPPTPVSTPVVPIVKPRQVSNYTGMIKMTYNKKKAPEITSTHIAEIVTRTAPSREPSELSFKTDDDGIPKSPRRSVSSLGGMLKYTYKQPANMVCSPATDSKYKVKIFSEQKSPSDDYNGFKSNYNLKRKLRSNNSEFEKTVTDQESPKYSMPRKSFDGIAENFNERLKVLLQENSPKTNSFLVRKDYIKKSEISTCFNTQPTSPETLKNNDQLNLMSENTNLNVEPYYNSVCVNQCSNGDKVVSNYNSPELSSELSPPVINRVPNNLLEYHTVVSHLNELKTEIVRKSNPKKKIPLRHRKYIVNRALRSTASNKLILRNKNLIRRVLVHSHRNNKKIRKIKKKQCPPSSESERSAGFVSPIQIVEMEKENEIILQPAITSSSSSSANVQTSAETPPEPMETVVIQENTFSQVELAAKDLGPTTLTNPLTQTHGVALHAYFDHDYLIVVQELRISFWKYIKLLQMFGKSQEWELLGDCERCLHDQEVTSPYKNRLCLNESSPVYLEFKGRQFPDDKFRECNMASIYVNIYYFDEVKDEVVLRAIQLDTIQGLLSDIRYTTITDSRYFIMCWRQEFPNNVMRTGLCKYALTPDLDTLASIRDFKALRYGVNHLECMNGEKLIGLGDVHVTIWNHHNGDVLINFELNSPLGSNLGSLMYSIASEEYLILYQNRICDNANVPELKVLAFNLTDKPHSFRLICTHELPQSFLNVKSSLNTGDFLVATASCGDEILLLPQQPHRLFYFNRTKSNNKNPLQSSDRYYTTGSPYFVEISDDNLRVKTFHEFLVDFIR